MKLNTNQSPTCPERRGFITHLGALLVAVVVPAALTLSFQRPSRPRELPLSAADLETPHDLAG